MSIKYRNRPKARGETSGPSRWGNQRRMRVTLKIKNRRREKRRMRFEDTKEQTHDN